MARRAETGSLCHGDRALWTPPESASVGCPQTQVHPALRSVKGAIIVDVPLKTDNEAFRQTACQLVAQKQAEITAGV